MLNILNRVVTVLALLALIACSALAAVSVFLPSTTRSQAASAMTGLFALPDFMGLPEMIVIAVVAGALILLAFILLALELRPPANSESLSVPTASGAETRVARNAINQRVQYSIDRLDDVIKVEPTIRGGGKGLTVHLDVVTAPYIDVPMKTEEIRAVARDVIEKQMGLLLKTLTVTIDHQAYAEFAGDDVAL